MLTRWHQHACTFQTESSGARGARRRESGGGKRKVWVRGGGTKAEAVFVFVGAFWSSQDPHGVARQSLHLRECYLKSKSKFCLPPPFPALCSHCATAARLITASMRHEFVEPNHSSQSGERPSTCINTTAQPTYTRNLKNTYSRL